ncbi:UNC93-like protein 3 [Diplonema papillatum]|nr:UNC93-like protein 3 [Diplonema papillatum]
MYDSIRHDVEEFVNSNFPKASEDEKTRFSTTLVEEFDAVLGTLNAHTDEPQLRDALRTLKKLQEHLVFLPVDKTSHDFGFICKEKYKELLRDELQQSSTYQEVGESIDDVLERHRDFNKSHKFVHTDNLPYLYGIPKLHKPEPRMRYIAGVSEKGNVEKKDEQKDRDEKGRDKKRMKTRASTTPAHQEASGLLKLVLATLRSKDEATFLQTGIRRFFVVESVDDVAVHIKTNYARLRKKAPRTFDFKEMYTKIPQKQIVDYVMSAVAEAFEYMKSEKGANVEAQRAKHRFEFGKPDESNTTSYNVEEIRALVSFIVGNTFVTNGGTCYQQVSGIPMGGNASPDLANLYCYWCEKQYIDGLVAKGLQEEARNHADSVRFIDDFLTWGVRPPPEDIYGMEYGETSKGVDDVVFLGMRIRMERNDKTDFIRMSVLDKGEEFPWNPIKYTHVESTVPRNTGTSIFKGALIRAARICNNMPDLKVEVMKVYYRLRNRGFSGRELRRTFDTFVAQTYGKYELDARVLSRFYHFVGKAYDEGRPTNEEKSYISIRTPQPPDGSPKHPPGRTSPQSTSPHKSEPTSTTHPATKPTNPPGRNGITNIRNSCFFAASVQFLARRTSFRLQLANLTHLDTNQQMVQRLFTDFDAGQNIHGTMATLRSLVFNTTADDSAHRDVHELLTWIRSCVTGDDDDQATVTYSPKKRQSDSAAEPVPKRRKGRVEVQSKATRPSPKRREEAEIDAQPMNPGEQSKKKRSTKRAELKRRKHGTSRSFFGVFYAIFQSTQISGNLTASLLLNVADWSNTSLFLFYLCFAGAGTLMTVFLVTDVQEDDEKTDAEVKPLAESVRGMLRLLKDKRLLALIPLIMYSGIQQGFAWGSYTNDWVKASVGLENIGYVMAAFGAADVCGSFAFGKLSDIWGRFPIICLGTMCQAAVVITLLAVDVGDCDKKYAVLLPCAALWGLGDATWNTQTSAVLSDIFPDKKEDAFANLKMWQSLSTATIFFLNMNASLLSQNGTLCLVGTALVVSFTSYTVGHFFIGFRASEEAIPLLNDDVVSGR